MEIALGCSQVAYLMSQTHIQSTVFLREQLKLHSYLSVSLKNDFLYIFLVCQCLGVFFFFVLQDHFDILQFSAFSITFVELKYDLCPRNSLLQWPCNVVIWKEIKPYAVPVAVLLHDWSMKHFMQTCTFCYCVLIKNLTGCFLIFTFRGNQTQSPCEIARKKNLHRIAS